MGRRCLANDDAAKPSTVNNPPNMTTLRHPNFSLRKVLSGAKRYMTLDEMEVIHAVKKKREDSPIQNILFYGLELFFATLRN
jgi:hypothetical protein